MKNSADLGGCYPPRPSASVDNTLLDLQNSSYPTRPHSIITKCTRNKIQARRFSGSANLSALVNITKYMYTLFEYKTKYQEEEVAKIKSMLFQAIAGYTLRKSENAYHTKRNYVESKKPLR